VIVVRGTDLSVDANSEAGHVIVNVPDERPPGEAPIFLTVPQSAQLRALLEKAEAIVSSGVGAMDPSKDDAP
jgi:hypothetical protein